MLAMLPFRERKRAASSGALSLSIAWSRVIRRQIRAKAEEHRRRASIAQGLDGEVHGEGARSPPSASRISARASALAARVAARKSECVRWLHRVHVLHCCDENTLDPRCRDHRSWFTPPEVSERAFLGQTRPDVLPDLRSLRSTKERQRKRKRTLRVRR